MHRRISRNGPWNARELGAGWKGSVITLSSAIFILSVLENRGKALRANLTCLSSPYSAFLLTLFPPATLAMMPQDLPCFPAFAHALLSAWSAYCLSHSQSQGSVPSSREPSLVLQLLYSNSPQYFLFAAYHNCPQVMVCLVV